MPSEQAKKLTRFGWLTVSALILFGGIRLAIHVVGVVRYVGTDDAEEQAEYLKTCKGFFGEPEGETGCQAWVKEGIKVRDRFLAWHMVLWVVAALISFATLAVACLVLKRNPDAAKYMFIVFLIQVLASLGEIAKAVLENSQSKEYTAAIWPGMDSVPAGLFFLDYGLLVSVMKYAVLCLFYWGLVKNVRSTDRIWV